MRKAFILTLIALGAIGSTCALVYYTRMDRLTFAWALNFLLMFCVLAFTETQKSPLTLY